MGCIECRDQSDLCLCLQGKLVYGNYGRQEDLDVLQKNNIEVQGSVMLLRAGKISFAEQASAYLITCSLWPFIFRLLRTGLISMVWFSLFHQVDNAATKGASAVLIYPDIQDYKYRKDTPLYGHVSLLSAVHTWL